MHSPAQIQEKQANPSSPHQKQKKKKSGADSNALNSREYAAALAHLHSVFLSSLTKPQKPSPEDVPGKAQPHGKSALGVVLGPVTHLTHAARDLDEGTREEAATTVRIAAVGGDQVVAAGDGACCVVIVVSTSACCQRAGIEATWERNGGDIEAAACWLWESAGAGPGIPASLTACSYQTGAPPAWRGKKDQLTA